MENRNFIIVSKIKTPIKIILGLAILWCLPIALYAQAPTITSVSPTRGDVGTTVTIDGYGFGFVQADIVIYFGATKADVRSIQSDNPGDPTALIRLTVDVPPGATSGPITVLNKDTKKIVYSAEHFVVTFDGTNRIPGTQQPISSTKATSVVLGDFDGDGNVDVAATDFQNGGIKVHRNTSSIGTISFANANSYSSFNTSHTQTVVAGDLDNDGDLDLAVVDMINNKNNASVSIFTNNSTPGSISFSRDEDILVGSVGGQHPTYLALGDLDGDGWMDMVVTAKGNNVQSVIVIMNNVSTSTTGSFGTPAMIGSSTGSWQSVAVGDIDGDKDLDIAAVGVGLLEVFTNNGSASFSKHDLSSSISGTSISGKTLHSVAMGDLDGDDDLDLAVANFTDHQIWVYENKTTFNGSTYTIDFSDNDGAATNYHFSAGGGTPGPYMVSIADADGDGFLDLVVANQTTDKAGVLLNSNSSSTNTIAFNAVSEYGAGSTPESVVMGDIDGDGKTDLVVGNKNSNTFSVLKNSQTGVEIEAFSFSNVEVISTSINSTGANTGTITVNLYATTPVTGLDPTFRLSDGATAKIGSVTQNSDDIQSLDFTSPVIYDVTAEDGSTTKQWTVSVSFVVNSESLFTSFSLTEEYPGAEAIFDETVDPHTIEVKVVPGTGLSVLKPTFSTSFGASVTINGNPQESGVTTRDFTNSVTTPVTYRVTAQNGTDYQDYEVTVTEGAPLITGVSPLSGMAGDQITLTGRYFNPVLADNTAYFGSVQANVSSVSADGTSLVVTVPPSAVYGPITVRSLGRIGASPIPFAPTFNGGNAGNFSTRTDMSGIGSGNSNSTTGNNNIIAGAVGDLNNDGKPDLAIIENNGENAGQGILPGSLIVYDNSQIGASGPTPLARFTTSNNPLDVKMADLDGDGDQDLIIMHDTRFNNAEPEVSYFANDLANSGSFISQGNYKIDSEYRGTALVVADMDQDGRVDLLWGLESTLSSDKEIKIARNTTVTSSFVSFAPASDVIDLNTAGIDFPPGAIRAGDFYKNDGKPDLVIAVKNKNNSKYLLYLYGNESTPGNFSFTYVNKYVISGARGIKGMAVGNMHGNGLLDFVIAVEGGSSDFFQVFKNTTTDNTSPSFSSYTIGTSSSNLNDPRSVFMNDLDGDGELDLAVANNIKSSGSSTGSVGVFSYSGEDGSNNNIYSDAAYDVPKAASFVLSADIDGNNRPELLVGQENGTVSLFTNTSTTDILSFSLQANGSTYDGVISTDDHTVVIAVPHSTNLTALTPTFTLSSGATASPASGVAQDFSNGPVTYTVTNGSDSQPWNVTVISIDIDLVAGDDVINNLESNNSLAVSGQTNNVYEAGKTRTVIVELSDGSGALFTSTGSDGGTVLDDGTWSVTIPQAVRESLSDGQSYTVTATVGVAQASKTITVDKEASITITTPIASDNTISYFEAESGVTFSGSTTGVEEDQAVTLTFTNISTNASHSHGGTVTVQADGTWSVTIPGTDNVFQGQNDGTYTVSATVSDVAGNQATSNTENINLNTKGPAITIDTNPLFVNSQTGDVTISGRTRNVYDASTPYTVTVKIMSTDLNSEYYSNTTDGTVGSDGTWSVTIIQGDFSGLGLTDGEYTLTADVSSATQATATLIKDTSAPSDNTIILGANGAGNDGYINISEKNNGMEISGTVNTQDTDGLLVKITLAGNSYSSDVFTGTDWTINVPAEAFNNLNDGTSYMATFTLTDEAGNETMPSGTTATKTLTADLTAPTVTFSVPTGADLLLLTDDLVNKRGVPRLGPSNLEEATVVQLEFSELLHTSSTNRNIITTVGDVKYGDAPNFQSINASGQTFFEVNLISTIGSGTVAKHGELATIFLAAGSFQDLAGNSNFASATFDMSLDQDATPIFTINGTDISDGDYTTNADEVRIDITLPDFYYKGVSELDLYPYDNSQETGFTLVNASIVAYTDRSYGGANGWQEGASNNAFMTVRPIQDGTVTVTLSEDVFTDHFYNNNEEIVLSFTFDKTAPEIFINAIATDDIIDISEAANNLTITGNTDKSEEGQGVVVKLTSLDGSSEYFSDEVIVDNNGGWETNLGGIIRSIGNGDYRVTADISDKAGNQASAFRVITATTSPIIRIDNIAGDNTINSLEADSDLTISGVTANVYDAVMPQTVNVTLKSVDGTTTDLGSGPVGADGSWSITVSATEVLQNLADGEYTFIATVVNSAVEASRLVTVDKTASISINTIAGDDRISASEAASGVAIDGTTTNVEDSQTVTVTLNGNAYTTMVSNGTWSVTIPDVSTLSKGPYTAVAQVSDVAGNPATAERNFIMLNTETDIIAFSFTEQTGPAMLDEVNHTVTVEVANGTNVSDLIATFSLSAGATAQVGSIAQLSGTTSNDFTEPVTYSVTAGDGITTQDWVVTVTRPVISGIENPESRITVYPNPSSSILNILWDKFQSATLYDLSGHEVLWSAQPQLDLSRLQGGVYILVTEGATGESIRTRIIKN